MLNQYDQQKFDSWKKVITYFKTEKKHFIADDIPHFADVMLLSESHCEGC